MIAGAVVRDDAIGMVPGAGARDAERPRGQQGSPQYVPPLPPRVRWATQQEYSNINRCMASHTYHVFPSDGAWAVKKAGAIAETYRTQGEAIRAARKTAKKAAGGQLIIHARDGRIREHETYGMTPIQDPPKKSRLAKRIGRAVGKVALQRVQADSHASSRALPSQT
jgi:hypothetical protein